MLKVFGKVFYFLFILLFFYIMYTYSNSVFINTYYNKEVYPYIDDSSKMIDSLVIPFGDRYDGEPVYQAKSLVENKEFEINFFTFESINNSPGLFITLNDLDFNHDNDLYIKISFDIGTIPSGNYTLHFDNKDSTTNRHFIRIMLNYEKESDSTYFSYSNDGESLKLSSINNFKFSFSLDGKIFTDFLTLKSNYSSDYTHSKDIFSENSNEPFYSENFSGNAPVFNMLNEDLESVKTVNTKTLTQYNYIIYRNMILSILGAFLLTFIIFYRKLIQHWFFLIKEKIKSRNK